jgi:hypothetical protein
MMDARSPIQGTGPTSDHDDPIRIIDDPDDIPILVVKR